MGNTAGAIAHTLCPRVCHPPARRIKIRSMEKVRAHAYVSGMVQGVFFRATTAEEAQRIGGLAGWVRNLPDGRVEVVCEGAKEKVEQLTAWLWHGPPSADVNDVNVTWGGATGEYRDFRIAYGRQ